VLVLRERRAEQMRARYGAFEMPSAPWVERDISLRSR
jgi:hypothetical protein